MQQNSNWAVQTAQKVVDLINNHDTAGINRSSLIDNKRKGFINSYMELYPDLQVTKLRDPVVDNTSGIADMKFTMQATLPGSSQVATFAGGIGIEHHSEPQVKFFVIDQLPLEPILKQLKPPSSNQGSKQQRGNQYGNRP
jgi:hypothetical protein